MQEIEKKTNIDRKGFIWNMVGSTVYAVVNMLLGTIAMRVLGGDLGGIFFFAFATVGQHIYILAYFGMRPMHIMDVADRFSFGDYQRFRFATCAVAMAAACVFAIIYSGISLKASIIVIMAIYKILDAMADVYECEFQRRGRLDMTGKIMMVRTVFTVICFTSVMLITKSLFFSCVAAVISVAISVLVMCDRLLKKQENVDYSSDKGSVKELFNEGKWLFLSIFLDLYVFTASKYTVDALMNASSSGYYSTLFTPASVVLLLSNFIIRPIVTKLSAYHENKEWDFMERLSIRMALIIVGITVFGMVFAYVLGVPCLTILVGSKVGAELEKYKWALVLIVAGGGMYALMNILYYLIIILDKQKQMCCAYLITIIPAFVISHFMVTERGITGAAVAFVLTMLIITLALFVIVKRNWRKEIPDIND